MAAMAVYGSCGGIWIWIGGGIWIRIGGGMWQYLGVWRYLWLKQCRVKVKASNPSEDSKTAEFAAVFF